MEYLIQERTQVDREFIVRARSEEEALQKVVDGKVEPDSEEDAVTMWRTAEKLEA